MNDTWTCNPDESKPTPAVEEPYHYPLPSECESPIYKPPPPLSPIPEVPSKQYIAGDLTLPDPGFEPMHEDEEDVLELHYAPSLSRSGPCWRYWSTFCDKPFML